jgi:hypothetical protein
MNTTATTGYFNWKEIAELEKQGQISAMNELGCNENWYRNIDKARRDGLPSCVHCGRGVNIASAWAIRLGEGIAQYAWKIDTTNDAANSADWVLVGSTCGPRLVGADFRIKASAIPGTEFREV